MRHCLSDSLPQEIMPFVVVVLVVIPAGPRESAQTTRTPLTIDVNPVLVDTSCLKWL